MRVAKNKFLVEVSDQFVRPNISGLDFIDTDYNPKILATKIGRIHTLPITLDDTYHYDIKLNVGDEVVFNHLVCQDRNKFQNNIFFCDYFNIFARLNDWNELQPLEEVIFCEKIIDKGKDIGCFKVPDKVSSKCAKVFEVSKVCYDAGIRKGDIVYFTKNADYEIIVAGNPLYKMHLRNIIGIERDGELKTFKNKLLVKNITELGSVGGIQRIYAHNTLQKGVVINAGTVTGIPVGTVLTYFNASATSMNWRGEEYGFVNEENIKYITNEIRS